MRAVVIGAILAFARHTMADPDTVMEKFPGALSNAFMPAVAAPQGASRTPVQLGGPGVGTNGASIATLQVINHEKNIVHLRRHTLQEVASDMLEQRARSQTAVTSPLTYVQTTATAFGYGTCVVFLLSIIYKIFYKWNHRTSVVNRSPSATSLQPMEAMSSPLNASNGELRTAGVVMQAVGDMRPTLAEARTPLAGRGVDGGEPFIHVQGQSLRTWSFPSQDPEQVQVILRTEGRPLDAAVELWHGPDNTPTVMRVYVEDGFITPFSAVIATPRSPNTVAVRNIGQVEFPLAANVFANSVDVPTPECLSSAVTVQGGAVRTFAFHPDIDTVQVLLTTDGRPLNARIELLQGPTNEKQIIELYNDDGMERPFFGILNVPGSGSVVRIVNTGPIEFPMAASVVPYGP